MAIQNVLITGATSGIGLALFEKYTNQGENVIACGRNPGKMALLESRSYKTCLFDITEPAQIAAAAQDIKELDILILNAGDCRYVDDVKNFDGELFSNIINTNLSSLGALLQYFLPKVKKGGQVVFVSSSATILPFPRSEAYGASKAGMDYLANSLRLDLLEHDIDVTLVHPGFVSTPLTDKNDFAMPFMLTSEQAASRMLIGIEKRKKYLHFPKRLTLIMKLFSVLPSFLWQSLITKNDRSSKSHTREDQV
ncbi:SDR family NAD(P)-dependent oxidoreductase [Colwellia psychrerythraea]|uniref:Oxidoreductase, short-chain dehydrogenase/reductase family n=1 Tax=Colwellia psychrerythraea (strain 34H / ATCC BAA-681) TaxID=167879 RepID=Q485Z0_COLP3|nr:SDR family NAD(P)-dependent oxidoreductase [Colwellia psychrerythraea]AAZ26690.1 oxidoreductase, short-chain dehydrogenase/reductase family [Colwellia psychrerythraea 34H]